MKIEKIHHVAYRCKDAKETVEFYNKVLGMDFQLAIAEDKVPSTGAPDPYMHVFIDAGNGNVLAFFPACPRIRPIDKRRTLLFIDDHDPYSRSNSLKVLNETQEDGKIVTGLIYLDKNEMDLHDTINSNKKPLNTLKESDLCPGSKGLDYVNDSFR